MADLSNSEIRDILKSFGHDCGPITPQTKSVYLSQIKKLQSIRNDRIPMKPTRRSEPLNNNGSKKSEFSNDYNKITKSYDESERIQRPAAIVSPISYHSRSYVTQSTEYPQISKPQRNELNESNNWYDGSIGKISRFLGAKNEDLLDISDADLSDHENTVFTRFRKQYPEKPRSKDITSKQSSVLRTNSWWKFPIDGNHLPNLLILLFIFIIVGTFGAYLTFKSHNSNLELDVAMERLICQDSQEGVCFSDNELQRLRQFLQRLYSVLCEHAGKNIYKDTADRRMSYKDAREYLKISLKQRKEETITEDVWDRLVTLLVHLPLDLLHIKAYNNINEEIDDYSFTHPEDVTFLECTKPKCSLLCRLKLMVLTVFNWLWYMVYTVVLVGVLVVIIYGLFLYRRRRLVANERKTEELREILSDICEILEDQLHRSQNNSNTDSFVSLDKIRVMLQNNYPRLRENRLWETVKQFTFKNEPRIEMRETLNHGICLQWRGQPDWQAPAVRNCSQTVSVLGPTQCLKIHNMDLDTWTDDWEDEIRSEVSDRVQGVAGIRHIGCSQKGAKVMVYVLCDDRLAAGKAFSRINNSQFNGNQVKVTFIRLDKYESRFPGTRTLVSVCDL